MTHSKFLAVSTFLFTRVLLVSDCRVQVAQYTLKIVARYLSWRAGLQHKAGRRPFPTSSVAPALTKFASLISDARLLHDFTGTSEIQTHVK